MRVGLCFLLLVRAFRDIETRLRFLELLRRCATFRARPLQCRKGRAEERVFDFAVRLRELILPGIKPLLWELRTRLCRERSFA